MEENTKLTPEGKKNNQIFKIIIGLILLVLLAALGTAYYKGNKLSPDDNFIDNISSGFVNITDNLDVDIANGENLNHKMFIQGEVSASNEQGNIKEIASLNVDELQAFSDEKSYNQRITVKNLTFKTETDDVSLGEVDMIGNKFKNYVKFNDSNKTSKLETLREVYPQVSKNITNAIENTDGYVMWDGEKTVMNTLGKLANNEIIRDLALSMAVSNPKEYLEETDTQDKLNKAIKKDEFLDYIFVENGKPTEVAGGLKQPLMINSQACSDYLPLTQSVVQSYMDLYGTGDYNIREGLKEEDCFKIIDQLNLYMQMGLQVYKEGDIEAGDFDFVIAFTSLAEYRVSYKDHEVSHWKLFVKTPDNKSFVFELARTQDGKYTSLLKVNYIERSTGTSIKGEIVNGSGELAVNSEDSENGFFGKIIFADYYVPTLNIIGKAQSKEVFSVQGSFTNDGLNIDVKADDNGEKVNMKFIFKEGHIRILLDVLETSENGILDFEYKDNKINFILKYPLEEVDYHFTGEFYNIGNFNIKGEGSLMQEDFNMEIVAKKDYFKFFTDVPDENYQNNRVIIELIYDNQKLSGRMGSGNEVEKNEITIDGFIKSFRNFNIKVSDDSAPNENYMIATAKSEKLTVNYNFELHDDKEIINSLNMAVTRGSQGDYKTYNVDGSIYGDGSYYDNEGNSYDTLNFSGLIGYDKGGAEYIIPKDYTEIDLSIAELQKLPALNEGYNNIFIGENQRYLVPAFIGGFAIGFFGELY